MAQDAAPQVLQLKVALAEIRPPIWRRLRVPAKLTLAQLHRVIQLAFGWEDCHLHVFRILGEDYGPADPDSAGETRSERVTLAKLGLKAKAKFTYEYDLGDLWEHVVTVEAVEPAEGAQTPVCLAGKRACPPEDCGGPWGYQDLIAAMGDPEHPDHVDIKEWLGTDHWDAEAFRLDQINAALAEAFAPAGARPPRKGKTREPDAGSRHT
jgi:hypothetical protein